MNRPTFAFLFLVFLSLLPSAVIAQQGKTGGNNPSAKASQKQKEPVEEFTDEDPKFPGKVDEYIKANLKYPSDSFLKNVDDANVIATFIVEKDGTLSDIKIEKSVSPECDAEAIRFLQNMPPWTPGKLDGNPVRTRFSFTVKFKDEEPIIEDYDVYPKFPEKMAVYINQNLRFPEIARADSVKGIVEAEFVVEKDGSISNIRITDSLSNDCDAEVVRFIKSMPAWKPGKLNGKPVRAWYGLAFKFKADGTVEEVLLEEPFFPNVVRYIQQHLQYPQKAADAGVQGNVMAKFVVEKDGSISNIVIARSVSKECDAEVIRLLMSMPHWTPGKRDRVPVRVKYSLTVKFKLSF